MPTLSAKYLPDFKGKFSCVDCQTPINGPGVHLYGMPDVGDKPYPLVFCARHAKESLRYTNDKKVLKALKEMEADL